MSYVYFLTDATSENGLVKIGVSNDIEKRMKQLSKEVPFELRCIDYIDAVTQNQAYKIEHFLHKHFKECRVMREWFDIPHESLVHSALEALNASGIAIFTYEPENTEIPPRREIR